MLKRLCTELSTVAQVHAHKPDTCHACVSKNSATAAFAMLTMATMQVSDTAESFLASLQNLKNAPRQVSHERHVLQEEADHTRLQQCNNAGSPLRKCYLGRGVPVVWALHKGVSKKTSPKPLRRMCTGLFATSVKMIRLGSSPRLAASRRIMGSPYGGKRSSHSTLSGTRLRMLHLQRKQS